MKVEDFLDYLKESKSKATYKEYKHGINKFAEWFQKTPNEILELRTQDWASIDLHQKKRFVREIEKFHNSLIQQGFSINSARTLCLGIMQLFRFYEMPVTIPSGSDVSKTVVSTKDFVPTPEQNREMFKVASDLRSKLIISLGKDLGWRIGDFVKIKKEQLPNLEEEAPLLFELITEKEDVIAKSFISAETVEMLKEYLLTLPKENPYLFPSNKEHFIDPDTINRTLNGLAEKSSVHIPKGKRLRFHSFRKRFLSTCANLSVDVNIAKILVGKDVESSMLAYLSEIEHRVAFIKVYDVLKLTEIPMRKTRESATDLEKRVDRLERLLYGVIATGGGEYVEKARTMLKLEPVGTQPFETRELEREEILEEVGRRKLEAKQKLSKEQLEEYRRIIAENGNNNHNE
jgi:integrase